MSKSSEIPMRPLSRRHFMSRAGQALTGVMACPLLGKVPRPLGDFRGMRSVIYLTMSGGMSHLDTFDPKPDCREVMGKTHAIATRAEGVLLGHHLPKTALVMDHVCVINSMQTPSGNHREAVAEMRGDLVVENEFLIETPESGSWEAQGDGQGIAAGMPSFAERMVRVDRTNRLFHGAGMGRDSNPPRPTNSGLHPAEMIPYACDLTQESAAIRKLYGPGRFAEDCLRARRLVESGIGWVGVELGGWDTHVDHFTAIAGRCAQFDQAFAALIIDLADRGMLAETLVVVATEFGRSPQIQAEHRDGRDHHPEAFSCLLAGAGVPGGTKIGKTDEIGSRVVLDPVSFKDLNEVISKLVGSSSKSGRDLARGGISNGGQLAAILGKATAVEG